MRHHVAVSVLGLEARLKASRPNSTHGLWKVLQYDDGNFLSFQEVKAEIERCKKLGYEVIPTCDYHDEKGHCKGHKE